MNPFNPQHKEQLINLLRRSRTSFGFSQATVKTRLLGNIEELQMSSAERRVRELGHNSFLRRHWITSFLTLALLVAIGSGATLAQADIAKPGTKFHVLDQLLEQFFLKLPLSESQKAKIQANIVDERNHELEYLIQNNGDSNLEFEAVKNSQESLNNAVEQVRSVREDMASAGKTRQAENLDTVLKRLEILAEEQEGQVRNLKALQHDEEIKVEFDHQLEAINQARTKAKREIKK